MLLPRRGKSKPAILRGSRSSVGGGSQTSRSVSSLGAGRALTGRADGSGAGTWRAPSFLWDAASQVSQSVAWSVEEGAEGGAGGGDSGRGEGGNGEGSVDGAGETAGVYAGVLRQDSPSVQSEGTSTWSAYGSSFALFSARGVESATGRSGGEGQGREDDDCLMV